MKEKEKGGIQCPQELHHEVTAATETDVEPTLLPPVQEASDSQPHWCAVVQKTSVLSLQHSNQIIWYLSFFD